MCGVNEAVETVIRKKAERIKGGLVPDSKYNNHIKKVLKQLDTNASEEQVRIFIVGAVDAMIYDVGSALAFTQQRDCVDDWTFHEKRQEMLGKIFS